MKPRSLTPRWWLVALLLVAAGSVEAALAAGGTAFAKRLETKLLAEPRPLAAVSGKVGYATKLTVEEARGAWLRVSAGSAAGWVFSGNLSDTPPPEGTGADKLGLSASETTATAAARPLTPVADEYARRGNLGSASEDLNWLLRRSADITAADVEGFLQEQKKGEFQ